MKDDRVVMPFFDVSHAHADPDWGAIERVIDTIGADAAGTDRTAYTWAAPIQAEADWDCVHPPVLRVDFAGTDHLVDLASGLFGDLLPVRLNTQWWWTLGMTWILIRLRGLEPFMFDLASGRNSSTA